MNAKIRSLDKNEERVLMVQKREKVGAMSYSTQQISTQ